MPPMCQEVHTNSLSMMLKITVTGETKYYEALIM